MKIYHGRGALSATLFLASSLMTVSGYGQDAASGAAACVPLVEQYPDFGTEQSVSANKEFETSWGSFEQPGGPCGYSSAEEHYNALLEDAKFHGGPTRHTPTTLPDWSGHWGTDSSVGEVTLAGINSTREGMEVRLTAEARDIFRRDLQMWDAAHAIDPISMCLPPNFPRWITVYSYREHFLTPDKTLLGAEMMNEFRRIFTDGRTHPSKEWLTNEWMGYSIGFWNEDVLTIWTKGIKEGILTRGMPRQSNELQVIERWRRVDPIAADALGRIEIEITLYDPTFVEPWHTVAAFYKEDDRTPELKEQVWPHLWSCVEGSNWYMTEEGVISQYAPGEKPQITNPDYWFSEDYVHE